jgi:hypothetical protein
MTYQLKRICPKVVVALEGGYDLDSLARCSESIIRTLLNEPAAFNDLLLKKEINSLGLSTVSLNRLFFCPSSYAVEQVNQVKEILEEYWPCLKTVNTSKVNKKLLMNDSEKINEEFTTTTNIKEYLFLNEEISNFKGDFLKFRIGQQTIPESVRKYSPQKFKKSINIDNRTLTRKLKFRLEGISLDIQTHQASYNTRQFNWVKRYGIFDTFEEDVSYIITKFLLQTHVSKHDFLDSLEKFCEFYEKNIIGHYYDLYNVDLVVIPKYDSEGVKETRKKKKNGVIIKLNGLKEYSIIKYAENENKESYENNFYMGLRSLIAFISGNLME